MSALELDKSQQKENEEEDSIDECVRVHYDNVRQSVTSKAKQSKAKQSKAMHGPIAGSDQIILSLCLVYALL
jgi:hypothetical protein